MFLCQIGVGMAEWFLCKKRWEFRCNFSDLCYSIPMWEFVGRWVIVMGVVGCLLSMNSGGASGEGSAGAAGVVVVVGGGWVGWPWVWMAGLWVGFWNALLRPLVLRFGMEGVKVMWTMGVVVFLVNGVLFYDIDTWVPVLGSLDGGARVGVGIASSLVSWGVSSVFHSHDRRWHWITYHGAVQRQRVSSHPDENIQTER